jgi:hypothetical protein
LTTPRYPAERIFLNPDCGFGTFSNRPVNTLVVDRRDPRCRLVELDRSADDELLPARGDARKIVGTRQDPEHDRVFLHLIPLSVRLHPKTSPAHRLSAV